MQRQLYTTGKQKEPDMKETNYYVIKKKAVPEVLLKVLEVQKLLDSKRAVSVLEATEKVESVEVLIISIRMIFSHFMLVRKDVVSHS